MTCEERDFQYAKTLQKLIQMDTVSVSGDVNPEKFRRFHVLLQSCFPHLFSVLEVEDFDGSLLMRWRGKNSDHPILLMSHHDVVEATGEWSHAPFSGEIADGRLWGRGTLDTKGSLWAMLQAAEELVADGYTPAQDIWFESACTEETDGSGAEHISRELERRGLHFDMVLDEGGMIVHDPLGGTDRDFALVGVGEKGAADLRFVAGSSGGHASMPGLDTPLVRLGKFMAAAQKRGLFRAQMSNVTCELFSRCAPYMTGIRAKLFSHVHFWKPLLVRIIPRFSDAANAMLRTTVAFTMAGGSQGRNVLPQRAWVIGNMRFSHHQGQQASFDAIRRLAERFDVEMEILDPGFASPLSDFRSPEFALVEKAVGEVYENMVTAPYVMTGASDCRYFGRLSENCFRFAPFRVSDAQLDSIHGIDENVDLDNLHRAVDFYKIIMKEHSHVNK
ncbi:MAG: M20/M25/M40 family metallo-hydrolase [Clostridia bacterium]|nr:M20/M25/M40 family metallo-hydrolase [Clostridia bacterium]